MRIGIDYHVAEGKFQGSLTYLDNLYSRVTKAKSDHQYFFYVSNQDAKIKLPGPGELKGFDSESRLQRLTFKPGKVALRDKIDLFHFQYVIPFWCPFRAIVSIHDILYESHPQYFSSGIWTKALQYMVRLSAQRAEHILTISEFTKSQLVEVYGIKEEKITVSPFGVDLKKFSEKGKAESRKLIQDGYGMDEYLLSVGRLEPRKNQITLLKAYHQLLQKGVTLPRLVLIGQRDFRFENIFELIETLKLKEHVLHLENISNEELPHFYRGATTMIFPSFAEGLGYPPLEAMASGCPVIATRTTGMTEAVEGAAITLKEPSNPQELAHAIQESLKPQIRKDLIEKGLKQVHKFSCDFSAKNVIELYDRLGQK